VLAGASRLDLVQLEVEFELLRSNRFGTREQARRAVAAWLDEYNTVRRHSTDLMLSPIDFERREALARTTTAAALTGQAGDAPRRLRVRPSGLKGRCAIAPRRPPAALDPGASADPDRHNKGQARRPAPGGARRSLPDYKITSIRVSTVWGDCQRL